MQVFKAYLKIIKKNIPQLMIYFVVFAALTIMMTTFNQQSTVTDFANTKIDMALFNDDASGDQNLINGLKNYLSERVNFVDIKDSTNEIKDAMFFGRITYVLRVPEGFTKKFNTKKEVDLIRSTAPNSTSAVYADMLINKYLNTYRLYEKGLPDVSAEKIKKYTEKNLKIATPVEMRTYGTEKGEFDNIIYFFNYLAYALMAILILGISTCMLTFGHTDLKRRNTCSPMTLKSLNGQLLLGNITFAFITWVLTMVIGIVLYGNTIFSPKGLLLMLNSIAFTIAAISISFLIGNAIKSRNAQSAMANVITLGTCFIGGVFVPQQFLGDSVLNIARFTPTYWFVKTNISIGQTVNLNESFYKDIYTNMGIQLSFAFVLLVLAAIVIRKKRVSK